MRAHVANRLPSFHASSQNMLLFWRALVFVSNTRVCSGVYFYFTDEVQASIYILFIRDWTLFARAWCPRGRSQSNRLQQKRARTVTSPPRGWGFQRAARLQGKARAWLPSLGRPGNCPRGTLEDSARVLWHTRVQNQNR